MIAVLYGVLILTGVIIGVTGLSDIVLYNIVDERLRIIKQQLAIKIKDPEQLNRAVEELKQELIRAYDLDKPWYARIPRIIYQIMVLDLGTSRSTLSFSGSNKVADIILERIPNTVLMVTTAVLISSLVGLVVGLWSATKVGSLLDRFTSLISAISYSLPTWWFGMVVILVFAYELRLFPSGGMTTPGLTITDPITRFLDLLWHLFLPVLTLFVALVGSWIYVTRSIVISITKEDFIVVGRAKGLPERVIRNRYLLRNSAPPILTNMILGLAGSITGAILTEAIFNWPGMGSLYYNAILSADINMILALTYIYTLVYVVARFILEVLYVVLDPRVRY
ncbi:MAG: ABC transporter permease [Desulfurococcaceae archaeon]|nr:ABC transporter permease [Desulfurococcaceae archaeon]